MSQQEINDRIALRDLINRTQLVISRTPDMKTIACQCYVSLIQRVIDEIGEELFEIPAKNSHQKCIAPGKLPPRFANVSCSNCGSDFGPGDHGYSHCENHSGKNGVPL